MGRRWITDDDIAPSFYEVNGVCLPHSVENGISVERNIAHADGVLTRISDCSQTQEDHPDGEERWGDAAHVLDHRSVGLDMACRNGHDGVLPT